MSRPDVSRRSSGRAAVRTILVIFGILLLLWGADAVARVAAQSVAARKIEAAAGLDGRPDVNVRGLLFLPQMFAGDYNHVEVEMAEVTAEGLRLSEVKADLFHLRVPFGDLVGGTIDQVVVDRTAERARVDYDDLNAYLERTGQPFTVSAGADGGAQVTGTVTVAGQQVQVDGDVNVTVKDGAVKISPRPRGADGGSPSTGQPFAFTLPLQELPYGQRLSDVRAEPEGVLVEAGGTDVVLPV